MEELPTPPGAKQAVSRRLASPLYYLQLRLGSFFISWLKNNALTSLSLSPSKCSYYKRQTKLILAEITKIEKKVIVIFGIFNLGLFYLSLMLIPCCVSVRTIQILYLWLQSDIQ